MKKVGSFFPAALCIAAGLVASFGQAGAEDRIGATEHSCVELRQIIGNAHSVLLTHPGPKAAGTLYDRYVSDSRYCSAGYVAKNDWVPASDGECRLQNCQYYVPPIDR